MKVELGNGWEDGIKTSGFNSGWFVGSFIDKKSLKYSDVVEVKFFNHKAGEKSLEKPVSIGKTLSILTFGCFKIDVKKQDSEIWDEYKLVSSGDYLIWGKNLDHRWEAIEDSTVITIRWK